MSNYFAPVALLVVVLAAMVAALVARSRAVQVTGVAVLAAAFGVLAPLTWSAGYRVAGLVFGGTSLAVVGLAWTVARQQRAARTPVRVTPVTATLPGLVGRTVHVETFQGRQSVIERCDGRFVAVLAAPVAGEVLDAWDYAASYAEATRARLVGMRSRPAYPVDSSARVRHEVAADNILGGAA